MVLLLSVSLLLFVVDVVSSGRLLPLDTAGVLSTLLCVAVAKVLLDDASVGLVFDAPCLIGMATTLPDERELATFEPLLD